MDCNRQLFCAFQTSPVLEWEATIFQPSSNIWRSMVELHTTFSLEVGKEADHLRHLRELPKGLSNQLSVLPRPGKLEPQIKYGDQ
jgi:hypothetical protein